MAQIRDPVKLGPSLETLAQGDVPGQDETRLRRPDLDLVSPLSWCA